jgi:hypothetical protein
MPFTTKISNAKVGLKLFGGAMSAVELTRTMLAAAPPQKKKLDGLELGAVRWGPDEIFDLGIRA